MESSDLKTCRERDREQDVRGQGNLKGKTATEKKAGGQSSRATIIRE